MCWVYSLFFFFFNDTATTEIYTLSLHDALPISGHRLVPGRVRCPAVGGGRHPFGRGQRGARRRVDLLVVVQLDDLHRGEVGRDRKSTRLNSSHANISYAVFCLKKKKQHY